MSRGAAETTVRFEITDGGSGAGRMRLRYDTSDPYAIHLTFPDGDGGPWQVARDTLAAGTEVPAGAGDVTVWPFSGHRLRIRLGAKSRWDDRHVVLDVPRQPVAEFLTRTWELVPRGSESAHLDVDLAILKVLTNGTAR